MPLRTLGSGGGANRGSRRGTGPPANPGLERGNPRAGPEGAGIRVRVGVDGQLRFRQIRLLAISEAARADLYTGLAEVLGRERAETLMAYLPTVDPVDVATRDDMRNLRETLDRRMVAFEARMEAFERRMDSFDRRMEAFEGALSRLYLTLVAGLFVIVAAMAGLTIAAP